MSTDIYCQHDGTGRKLSPSEVGDQCLAAREAAKRGFPPNFLWCVLAQLTYGDYSDSLATLRLNAKPPRAKLRVGRRAA
jgi:hypothetical protein